MARKLVHYIEITDDFDRENPADETVEVAIDGLVYELDLTTVVAKGLREYLAPFQDAAHDKWRMPPRPGRKGKAVTAQALTQAPKPRGEDYAARLTDKAARDHIRAWAKAQGQEIAMTGKIPVETIKAFMIAEPDAYVPETTLRDAGLLDA